MIPEELTEINAVRTGFLDGELPSYLITHAIGGGSVTINDASSDGGYARLDSGTTATGDGADVKSSVDFQPAAEDAYFVEFEFQTSDGDETLIDSRINLYADGDNYIHWEIQNNQVHIQDAGVDTYVDTSEIDPTNRHRRGRIIWYTGRGKAEFILDGIVHAEISAASLPDPSLSYQNWVFLRTNETSATRQMDLYRIGAGYATDTAVR